MEIIFYVRLGVGTYEDSVGNIGRTVVGDVR
jgi:redox-sensitive bicupin YhaK (pirin superfamily)